MWCMMCSSTSIYYKSRGLFKLGLYMGQFLQNRNFGHFKYFFKEETNRASLWVKL